MLGRFPCPMGGNCCFCRSTTLGKADYKCAPPPPEFLRGQICDSMFQHCYSECCQPDKWTKIF